jgi:hypothetical protein
VAPPISTGGPTYQHLSLPPSVPHRCVPRQPVPSLRRGFEAGPVADLLPPPCRAPAPPNSYHQRWKGSVVRMASLPDTAGRKGKSDRRVPCSSTDCAPACSAHRTIVARVCLWIAPRIDLEQGRRRPRVRVSPRSTSRCWRRQR